MENANQLQEQLKALGLKARFKPYQETESRALCLTARRPAEIVAGKLAGAMFDLFDCATFRIWTAQTKKARAAAARYGLRLRLMDGECELFIPAILADEILPKFGAKVRRALSEEQRQRLRAIGFKNNAPKPTQEGSKPPPKDEGQGKTH